MTAAVVKLGHMGTVVERGRERLAGINGLRAVGALAIIAYHAGPTSSAFSGIPENAPFRALRLGVDLFFVISGFLLFIPFATALAGRGRASYWRYGMSRFFRIVPLYVLINGAVFWRLTPHPAAHLGILAAAVTFSGRDILSVAWSLDDEVRFYLLLPLLFAAVVALPQGIRFRAAVVAVACLGVMSAVYEAALQYLGSDQAAGGAAPKFCLFAAGMLLAALLVRHRPRFTIAGAAAGLAAAGFLLAAGAAMALRQWPFGDLIVGAGFAGVLAVVVFGGDRTPLARLLASWPAFFLGEVSYGLYLWHEPVHHALFNAGLVPLDFLPGLAVVSMATVLVSAGTYILVERPALRLGAWLGAHPPALVRRAETRLSEGVDGR